MRKDRPEMCPEDVVEIVQLLNHHNIEVIIDGGWGVDALLGIQTRPHEDLDVAVYHKDVPEIRALLGARGFREVPRDDTWECNFVLGDEHGRLVDIHSCTFDQSGNNIFGVAYPLDSLQGRGFINGHQVRCIPPHWLVEFHTGYDLDEDDFHDVKLLCARFDIPLPEEYRRFASTDTG